MTFKIAAFAFTEGTMPYRVDVEIDGVKGEGFRVRYRHEGESGAWDEKFYAKASTAFAAAARLIKKNGL